MTDEQINAQAFRAAAAVYEAAGRPDVAYACTAGIDH